MTAQEMRAILEAANELELWLADNTGCNADWPFRLVADNDQTAQEVADRLAALHNALKPFRDENPECLNVAESS